MTTFLASSRRVSLLLPNGIEVSFRVSLIVPNGMEVWYENGQVICQPHMFLPQQYT